MLMKNWCPFWSGFEENISIYHTLSICKNDLVFVSFGHVHIGIPERHKKTEQR